MLPRHHIFIMILLCHMQCAVSNQVTLSCYVWDLIQLTEHLPSGTTGGTKGWKAPPRNGKRKKGRWEPAAADFDSWSYCGHLEHHCHCYAREVYKWWHAAKSYGLIIMLYADVFKPHKLLVSGARDHFLGYTYVTVENCLLTLLSLFKTDSEMTWNFSDLL